MDSLALILAAGKGTRLQLDGPKVMQLLLDRPLLWYVFRSLRPVFGDNIFCVVGYGREEVETYFTDFYNFVYQQEQRGTGHAVQCAWEQIESSGAEFVVVCNGDTPLVPSSYFQDLLQEVQKNNLDVAFLSIELPDPGNYGRVIRDKSGNVCRIVEAKDLNEGVESKEVNAGVYCFRTVFFKKYLFELKDSNRQQEYYITDLIELAINNGLKVRAINKGYAEELLGINTVKELVRQEELVRKQIVDRFLTQGVLIRFPQSVAIGPEVEIEPGVKIQGPTKIYGQSSLYRGAEIGSYTYISDAQIWGRVHEFSHIVGSVIKTGAQVGPYARLRPGTVIEHKARVGNFVEVKKTVLGKNSKANHLTYLGDSEIGEGVNIGAGTITCNYDGKKKYKTTIEDMAFIGSNTALVAPVSIGKRALIGAGSTITKDVPEGHLAIARAKQFVTKRGLKK
ncbi:MAG: bifunctional UDP-N-acetylglucosamine diphosphorylase/glucosamine-1-phosphate N-acetyltransferase GlmU [Desulfonauticus sp.]|nr:bifunctional UDP-N-acetylglucosamine diphosphorylase/glucosamine-1-phosphate N-acetyltransferase GlmU [Desulfonauticus sp.]